MKGQVVKEREKVKSRSTGNIYDTSDPSLSSASLRPPLHVWQLLDSPLSLSSVLSPVIFACLWGPGTFEAESRASSALVLLPGILQICGSFVLSVVLEEQEKETHK